MPDVSVTVVTVAPCPTAFVARTTTWAKYPAVWPRLLNEVYAVVRPRPQLSPTPNEGERWRNVMLYKDDRPSVEVGVLAAGPFDGGGFVVSSELPGGRAATAIHRGDHAQLGRTHEAILRFIEEQGFQRAGPRWEIYGHWREDPRELATEIYARRRWPAQSSARRRPRRVRGRSRPGRGRSRDGEPMPLLAPVTTAILSLSRRFMIAATQRQPSAT